MVHRNHLIFVLFHVLIHSSVRSITLFCKKTISLKFSFSNLETTFSVQNIIVSPIITSHPIVKTHNTPTSISTGKNSGWESGNTPFHGE